MQACVLDREPQKAPPTSCSSSESCTRPQWQLAPPEWLRVLQSSTRHTDQRQQSRDDMSGVQEGQGQPLNLLITLSPNFPSRRSLTQTALCALAQSCCNQKHRLVITTRTSNQTTSAGG